MRLWFWWRWYKFWNNICIKHGKSLTYTYSECEGCDYDANIKWQKFEQKRKLKAQRMKAKYNA